VINVDKVAYYEEQIYKEAGVFGEVAGAIGKGLTSSGGFMKDVSKGGGIVNSFKKMNTAGKVTTGVLGAGVAKAGLNAVTPKPVPAAQPPTYQY
jgi:hypothetical protein